MSKVGAIYWSKNSAGPRSFSRRGAKAAGNSGTGVTRWMGLAVVIGTMAVLCLAVNFRAYMEVNRQTIENQRLHAEAEQLSSLNLILQEEIKNLEGDPKTIEREARKIGMSRPNEKILVPTN